ncbi:kinesin motor domain-containing protein [Ditylenchus destructor]|uniref:Kinesin motor domain-containing protein n=1 Tax=Ditylenchus destructor TaxID=166010 RepID=A0AAD4R413_9BILA|nr:kinesin motor domain-containing protein [Ditylenchus destructor]
MTADNNVRVALRIRPQSSREKAEQSRVCTYVVPGVPQITIGDDRSFTYDHVFDRDTTQATIYDKCVHDLVAGTFDGYNATVLAYGQTGSGKTYTMGTSFESTCTAPSTQLDKVIGIIPRAARQIFDGIQTKKEEAKARGLVEPVFEVSVTFIELYNEEILDLLAEERRNAIKIHEDPTNGEIYLKGVARVQVNSGEEIMQSLRNGSLKRTTAETNMNQASSRSHAIFSLQIKQQRMVSVEDAENVELNGNPNPATELEVLTAKFHFVDLAGSERLKRTGATGDRQKEGISINCGLLALGNVISALGGGAGKVMHVPYRDSKLTRLLQDSLGGNSRTLMIACASPSDVDFVETLNTLNYANRAKNIKNRVVANQDKSSKLIGELRSRIATLEAELMEYQQGRKVTGEDGYSDQYLENVSLQHENQRLRTRVKALDETIDILKARSIQLQQKFDMANINRDENDEADNDATMCGENAGKNTISSTIRNYLEELENLRIQLFEARSTIDELRKQNNRYRSQAECGSLPVSPYVMSTDNSDALIKAAQEDIRKQKLLIGIANGASEANGADSENGENGADGLDEEEENPEIGSENDESDSESAKIEQENEQVHSKERDRLANDLATLQEDISIKERLVAELEARDRRLAQIKHDYERKLCELTERISTIEAERDKVIAEITAKPNGGKQAEEKVKQVKDDYEKKIGSLKSEFKKFKSMEKEHNRMQMQQNKHMEETRRLMKDIAEMKRNKVELMKKLKEENKKARDAERENMKRFAGLEKVARQQENQIRQLKVEAAHKAEQMKRKTEEVQKLREKQKAQQYGSRRQMLNTTTVLGPAPVGQFTPMRNPRLSGFDRTFLKSTPAFASPAAAKKQFSTMEKTLSRIITQKQTLSKMEEEMDRLVNERQNLQTDLHKMSSIKCATKDERNLLAEELDNTKEKLNYVQEQIMNLQKAITDVDATFNTGENVGLSFSDNAGLTIVHVLKQCAIIYASPSISVFLAYLKYAKSVGICVKKHRFL